MSDKRSISIFWFGIAIAIIIFIIGATLGTAKLLCWFTNAYLDPAEPVKFWLCLLVMIMAEFVGLVYLFADKNDRMIIWRIN